VDNRLAGRSRLWIALVNAEFFQKLALKDLRVNGQPSQPQNLAYQEAAGPRIRATLAAFFFAGTVLSLASLAAAGQMHRHAVVGGLELLPFMVAGFALSGPLRRYLDKGRIRATVLTLAAASAVVLVVRGLA